MIHSKTAILFIALLGISLAGCKPKSPAPAQVKDSGAIAPLTAAPGTVVIEPQFREAYPFHDGLAQVEVGDNRDAVHGYVDRAGVFKVNPKYQGAQPFSEGLAAVSVSNGDEYRWGYVDSSGSIVIEPQFGRADEFEDGAAVVVVGPALTGQHGLVDKSGKYLINPHYEWLDRIGKDRYSYRADTNLWGILDRHGAIVAPPKFASLSYPGEGLIAASFGKGKAERCGYVDGDGKLVINPQFIRCRSFNEGLAAVVFDQEDGQRGWGFVDKAGKLIIKTPYPRVESFHGGLAAVTVGTSERDAKLGFIDKRGTLVIAPQFDEVRSFRDGRAAVRIGGGYGNQRMTESLSPHKASAEVIAGKWGVIDNNGRFVVNPRFDAMGQTEEGLAPVRVGNHLSGTWGFMQL